MKTNYINYNFEKSIGRLDDILNASNDNFKEVNSIPSRDSLTFLNGYYTNCTVLYVDIRDSSSLSSIHTRPVLAKIYRAYISEVVAIMNGNINCKEINIEGDCVWGIFDTYYKSDMNGVFIDACKISSLIDILNCKLKKKKFTEINIGIGIDYGKALMIKGGYNGSGINDIVWMGDVVNNTSKLCSFGNKTLFDKEIMISSKVFEKLSENSKSFMSWNKYRSCYHGDVIFVEMNDWKDEHCN